MDNQKTTLPDQSPILRTEALCRQFQSGREIVKVLDDIAVEIPRRSLTILRGTIWIG